MASKYRSLHSDKLIDQKLLLKEQRTWLRRSRAECGKRSDIASCLKEEYGTRYAELLAYPHSTEKRRPSGDGETFTIDDMFENYIVEFILYEHCGNGAWCEGAVRVITSEKSAHNIVHAFHMQNAFLDRQGAFSNKLDTNENSAQAVDIFMSDPDQSGIRNVTIPCSFPVQYSYKRARFTFDTMSGQFSGYTGCY